MDEDTLLFFRSTFPLYQATYPTLPIFHYTIPNRQTGYRDFLFLSLVNNNIVSLRIQIVVILKLYCGHELKL